MRSSTEMLRAAWSAARSPDPEPLKPGESRYGADGLLSAITATYGVKLEDEIFSRRPLLWAGLPVEVSRNALPNTIEYRPNTAFVIEDFEYPKRRWWHRSV